MVETGTMVAQSIIRGRSRIGTMAAQNIIRVNQGIGMIQTIIVTVGTTGGTAERISITNDTYASSAVTIAMQFSSIARDPIMPSQRLSLGYRGLFFTLIGS